MKKMNNKKAIIFIMVTFVSVMMLYLFQNPSNPPILSSQESYLSGFDAGTQIDITTLSKDKINTKNIMIENAEKIILHDISISKNTALVMTIKQNQKSYDITALQKEGALTLTYDNLPLDSKITLSDHVNVPVDWAGKLVLTASNPDQSFCTRMNEKEKICLALSLNNNNEVTG